MNFRTYEENGLLVYHTFSSEGFVKLFLEDARLKVLIVSQDMPDVELNNFDQVGVKTTGLSLGFKIIFFHDPQLGRSIHLYVLRSNILHFTEAKNTSC